MTYGIEILNESSYIQIDGTTPTYSEYLNGTMSIDKSKSASMDMTFSTPFTQIPIVMAKGPIGVPFYADVSKTKIHIMPLVAGTHLFNYKVFLPTSSFSVPNNTYGLAVFSDTGSPVFIDSLSHLRIVGISGKAWSINTDSMTVPSFGFHPYVSLNSLFAFTLKYPNGNSDFGFITVKVNADFSIFLDLWASNDGSYNASFDPVTRNVLFGR